MGSLFKPSTTVVQAPSQQTVTSQIPEYFKEIQDGPIYPCICCIRCLPRRSVRPFQVYFLFQISKSHNLWPGAPHLGKKWVGPRPKMTAKITKIRFLLHF